MDVECARSHMDTLERRWFEINRTATAARMAVAAHILSKAGAAMITEEQARLEEAEQEKREIMRQIEAIEDSLLEDSAD